MKNLITLITLPLGVLSAYGQNNRQLAHDIFKELIEINTTHSIGNTTEASEAMAARLKTVGFTDEDLFLGGPHPKRGNLVARLKGTGARKPLLLLAHIDVVEANPSDWSVDPFKFQEIDEYYYGRGTSDDKAMAAIWIANLIRMKQEGFKPDRDIIVALTADEEGGQWNGVSWLLENHRNLIDAEYALNEGGGGQIMEGRKLLNEVQLSEKVYQSFALEVRNPGGHSSLPRKDNAINQLVVGLSKIAGHQFPLMLNQGTREFFQRMAKIETGIIADDMQAITISNPDPSAVQRLGESPYYNALMRTTCVATMLEAGHAENALPQLAKAVVNCRMLPNHDPKQVLATLIEVVGDDKIKFAPMNEATASQPTGMNPEVMGSIERVTQEMWPGVPVVPTMVTGATDGLYLRNAGIPTFGVSGLFEDISDVRAHGRDERIGVNAFYEGHEFLYRLVKTLSSSSVSLKRDR